MTDQFYGLTDIGNERKNNEDTFIAQQSANGKFIIACVIDGVGGYSGGEIAAALARESILQRLGKPSGEVIPMMIDCFNLANQKILDEKKQVKEHESMACVATLALVDVEQNQFYYVHVGDTRLYLLRDQSLVKISRDQSFVGFLEDSGRLDEKAAMTHPKRNEINKALGFEANLGRDTEYIETGQSPFLPGDMLLLCSDGLTDMVSKSEMSNILNNSNGLKDKCRELIAAANNNGGKDNITVVLVKNSKQTTTHNATMPTGNQKKNERPDIAEPMIIKTPVSTTGQQHVVPAKRSNWVAVIFALLALVFLSTTIWQFSQRKADSEPATKPAPQPIRRPLSKLEVKLQNAIDGLKGNLLLLSDTAFTAPIIISQPIKINKDTLFIKTKGDIRLQSDSGYKGAAFTLSPKCKLVMLDSLAVSNFQTGVTAYNNALLLKNIRFINCTNAIKNLFTIKGKYTSGSIPAQIFKVDSIPVTHKQK
ncbi:PP2C family protein-serine/threonine phosphatase [Mucilaginibacter boryungensis]|uniref:Serine/threonine-protein phosphatase n=1 Tax=Mucilaginibacter boryungensis TaxID=768480 RepID=A0ABR9XIG4_9SPHI|nr:protein phosphatase 2C domain-containing protein [Mucilaginibacter boryungensis]MBE9667172.1 serine/threonine-protein phosphatase [Mucilaginibacter boryungensis]